MRKYLMHKDIPVALVDFEYNKPKKIAHVYDEKRLPPGLDIIPVDVWNKQRVMPDSRPNINLAQITLGILSMEEAPSVSRAASLTDCYWFASEEELAKGVNWKQVNFYQNDNPEEIGKMLITGEKVEITNFESCDITTNGRMPKRWVKEEDGYWLIKQNTPGKHEVFSEVAASLVAEHMGVEHVPYYYIKTEDGLFSMCPNFVKDDSEEAITLTQLKWSGEAENLEDFAKEHHFEEVWGRAKGFACVINDIDNHANNNCVIRDTNTLEYKSFVSFDHGESFATINKIPLEIMESRLTDNYMDDDLRDSIQYFPKKIDIKTLIKQLNALGKDLDLDEELLENILESSIERFELFNEIYDKYHELDHKKEKHDEIDR